MEDTTSNGMNPDMTPMLLQVLGGQPVGFEGVSAQVLELSLWRITLFSY